MTTARLPSRPGRRPFGDTGPGTARLGEWTFRPAAHRPGEQVTACLERPGRRVPLRYSSTLLEEFLRAMSRIQADFSRRSEGTEPTVLLHDHPG